MQARRPTTTSAFRGGAATAAILLALVCAPCAHASKIEPRCTDRPAALDVAGDELDSRLTDAGPGLSGSDALPDPAGEDAEHVPPSAEFQAVMTRILEASLVSGAETGGPSADQADVSPVAEADVDVDTAERVPADADWASDSAELPGIPEAAAERYRRQMYRTDI
jgi:hypothetical protein